ncbi:MAG: hypothetical protein HYT79_06475 [Elusimicrobia bacterium]|nr:hypothetical protein [Elusimicrobiota bacterium]
MIIWLLERPDKKAQAECLEFLARHTAAVTNGRVAIHWRILPGHRLWAECVELVKRENYPENNFPSIIEYPLAWQESMEYLNLLARTRDIEWEPARWEKLIEHVLGSNYSAVSTNPPVKTSGGASGPKNELITLPWMVGLTSLFYRKDLLRLLNKTPEDLETYSGWMSAVAAAREKNLGLRALEMPLTGAMAMWWILNFGGQFLDPLNLMPAFHQAEALRALEAMLNALVPETGSWAQSDSAPQRLAAERGFKTVGRFPDQAFCQISTAFPSALRQNDPRIGCLLPPRITEPVVVAEEFALGVTRRPLELGGAEILAVLEAWLGDDEAWSSASIQLGVLPARLPLWESFFDGIADPMIREVYWSATSHQRWIARSPYLAPVMKVFEDSLMRLHMYALHDGVSDARHIAAVVSRAVAEYRLLATLYGSGAPSGSAEETPAAGGQEKSSP